MLNTMSVRKLIRLVLMLALASGYAVSLARPAPAAASHNRAAQLTWTMTGPNTATFEYTAIVFQIMFWTRLRSSKR